MPVLDLMAPLLVPRVRVSSEFGPRGDHFHDGVDLLVPVGTPVGAVAAGTVLEVYRDHPLAGHSVWIDHGGVLTGYSHLSSLQVHPGDQIPLGILVGTSGGQPGAPGAGASSAPHLHFAIHLREPPGRPWTERVPLNPLSFVQWGSTVVERFLEGQWRGFLARPVGGGL